jgi:hypothetical protein
MGVRRQPATEGSLVGKTDYRVHELVAKIERRELQLPEMQRQYVWTKTKVRDLLDSLYRGYPSGTILAWEPAGDVETRAFAVATDSNPGGTSPLLLLDGQQRLTSLSSVLRGEPVTVRDRKRPVEIMFNLEHPDELTFITEVADESTDATDADDDELVDEDDAADDTDDILLGRINRRAFVVASNKIKTLPNWVAVTDVFKKDEADLLAAAGVTDLKDPRYKKYSSRLQRLRNIANYEYRVDVLEKTKSYEEVTEIFVRVNSLGAKLRSSDLALAQITAKWNGSLALFNGYQAAVKKRGFELDLGIILRNLVAISTDQSRFLTVSSLTKTELETGWKQAVKAFDHALNFVEANAGINSPTYLSSPFLLITTSYWAHKREYKPTPDEVAAFRKWLLLANAKGRYSRGSSETILDQDLAVLRDGGGPDELVARLLQQVGRLDFTPEELEGRTYRNAVFKTLFLALAHDKAVDWETGLVISPKHAGKADKIEYHHIFPKAYLKVARPDLDAGAADDLANLAFIGAKTNNRIRARAPKEYRKDFDQGRLMAQLVDFDDGRDEAGNFKDFLDSRRFAIAKKLNEFLAVG